MSPTVFRIDGFRFFFFSREETRMHIHIYCADGEAKYWLEPKIELAKNYRISSRKLTKIEHIIEDHYDEMTKSQLLGKDTSITEVSNISSHGVWIYTNGQEFFLSFEDFPWFKDASVNKIINVEEPSSGHYFWPDLDIDLSINMIKFPENFPLIAK